MISESWIFWHLVLNFKSVLLQQTLSFRTWVLQRRGEKHFVFTVRVLGSLQLLNVFNSVQLFALRLFTRTKLEITCVMKSLNSILTWTAYSHNIVLFSQVLLLWQKGFSSNYHWGFSDSVGFFKDILHFLLCLYNTFQIRDHLRLFWIRILFLLL